MKSPRIVDVYDTKTETVGSTALADVAADIQRYELLTTDDDPAQQRR